MLVATATTHSISIGKLLLRLILLRTIVEKRNTVYALCFNRW